MVAFKGPLSLSLKNVLTGFFSSFFGMLGFSATCVSETHFTLSQNTW